MPVPPMMAMKVTYTVRSMTPNEAGSATPRRRAAIRAGRRGLCRIA
jgi:hypothetical protein